MTAVNGLVEYSENLVSTGKQPVNARMMIATENFSWTLLH